MPQFKQLKKEITDIEQYLNEDKVKIIKVRRNSKVPLEKDYYNKQTSIEELMNYTGNFGTVIGYNHDINGVSLACIDIDGYTMANGSDDKKKEIKKATADYIYNCLKDIPDSLIIETQSGGHHIYLWNETISDSFHHTSNHLCFPADFPIEDLQNQSLNRSIEIFTKPGAKQCVLPPSTILNEDTGDINGYKVVSEINALSDIGRVNDINQTVIDTLLEKGFTYNETAPQKRPSVVQHSVQPTADKTSNPYIKKLNKKEIKKIVSLLTPILKEVDGAKHDATLYIGGFLSENISVDSVEAIADSIVAKIGNIFDDGEAFKQTLIVNYQRNEIYKRGLPSLCDLIDDMASDDFDFDRQSFLEQMNTICRTEYELAPNIIQRNDGLYIKHKKGYSLLGNIKILELKKISDSMQMFPPVFNIRFIKTENGQEIYWENLPFDSLKTQLDKETIFTYDAYRIAELLRKLLIYGVNKDFNGYTIIKSEIDLFKQGFFYDDNAGKVLQNNSFDFDSDSEDIKKSIRLFNEVIQNRGTAIPNDCSVFRFMLWSPFSYAIKQIGFIDDLYGIVLPGTSNTNKTGSVRIFSHLYAKSQLVEGKADTLSSFTRVLTRNTFPVLNDEALTLLDFEKQNNREAEEVLKRCITDLNSRGVSDITNADDVKEYHALRMPIFTLNNDSIKYKDEFLKRYRVLSYDESMKIDKADAIEFNKKYSPQSPRSPLKQLKHLGKAFAEKFIPYIENHSNELYNLEKLTIKILKEISTECGEPFNTDIYEIQEYNESASIEQDAQLRNGLNEIFIKKHKTHNGTFAGDFIRCALDNEINWLDYQKRNKIFLIKPTPFKDDCNRILNGGLSIKSIFELLGITLDAELNPNGFDGKNTTFKGKSIPVLKIYPADFINKMLGRDFGRYAEDFKIEKPTKQPKAELVKNDTETEKIINGLGFEK